MALARLPAELLQRIASFCPGDDVLSLSSACHYFRSSCYDTVVLQASFVNHTPEATTAAFPTRRHVLSLIKDDLARLGREADTATWARLSSAAAQLDGLGERLETLLANFESVALITHPFPGPDVLADTKNMVGVLSTFAVLGSPQVNDLTTTAALTGLVGVIMEPHFWTNEEPVLDLAFCSQLLFCVTTGLLGNTVLNNMIVLALRVDEHIAFLAGGQRILYSDKISSWLGYQTFGLLRQSVMTWIMQSSTEARARNDALQLSRLPLGRPRQAQGAVPKFDGAPLPLPKQDVALNPLAAFAASENWVEWMEATVHDIAKHMEEGEWYGYSTTGTSRSTLGSPMSNIKFVFDPNYSIEGIMRFRAEDCVDELGTFTFSGRVWTGRSPECGHIFFRQERPGIGSWQHFGSITPMGITGYWGGRETGLGLFWLWRRDWMEPDPKPGPELEPEPDQAM